MSNFVYDNTSLNGAKVNRGPLPGGEDPNKWIQADQDWNPTIAAMYDLRDAIISNAFLGVVRQTIPSVPVDGASDFLWADSSGNLFWHKNGTGDQQLNGGGGGGITGSLTAGYVPYAQDAVTIVDSPLYYKTSTARFGINTITPGFSGGISDIPGALLHVVNATTHSIIAIESTAASSDAAVLLYTVASALDGALWLDESDSQKFKISLGGINTHSGRASNTFFQMTQAGASKFIGSLEAGTTLLVDGRLTAAGKVGINDATTDHMLSIANTGGGIGAVRLRAVDADGISSIDFYDDANTHAGAIGQANTGSSTTRLAGKMFLLADRTGNRFVLDDGSNIGIDWFLATSSVKGEWADGQSAAVSTANRGAIRYNNSTKLFETSLDTGAWSALGGVSGLTSGRVVFATAATSISTDGALLWDNTGNKMLSITTTSGGLNVGHSVHGTYGIDIRTTKSADVNLSIANTDNSGFSGFSLKDNTIAQRGSFGYGNTGVGLAYAQNTLFFYSDNTTTPPWVWITSSARLMTLFASTSGNLNLGPATSDPGVKLSIEAASASAGIALGNGSTLAVSASNTGRIRYNSSGQIFEQSLNGGSYVPLSSGSLTGSLSSGTIPVASGSSTLADSGLTWSGSTLGVTGSGLTINAGGSDLLLKSTGGITYLDASAIVISNKVFRANNDNITNTRPIDGLAAYNNTAATGGATLQYGPPVFSYGTAWDGGASQKVGAGFQARTVAAGTPNVTLDFVYSIGGGTPAVMASIIKGLGSSASFQIDFLQPSGGSQLTIPVLGGNDTLATLAATQTLTNKTLTGNIAANFSTGITTATFPLTTTTLAGLAVTQTFTGTNTFNNPITLPQIKGNGSAPSFVADTGLGTSPTVTLTGTDIAHLITMTVGTGSPAANARLLKVTFASAMGAKPKGWNLSPVNQAATALAGAGKTIYIDNDDANTTASGYALSITGSALNNTMGPYEFSVTVIQ